MTPIDGLHLCGRVSLGHYHRFIPIWVKPHPKPKITVLLLLKSMIVLKPQVLELMLSLHIVHHPVAIVLSSGSIHWCWHPDDLVLKIMQVIITHLGTGDSRPLHPRPMSLWSRPTSALCPLWHLGRQSFPLGMSTRWSCITSLFGIRENRWLDLLRSCPTLAFRVSSHLSQDMYMKIRMDQEFEQKVFD